MSLSSGCHGEQEAVDDSADGQILEAQQRSTSGPQLFEWKDSVFPKNSAHFDFYRNLPSKQGVVGSSPTGRTNIFNSLRHFRESVRNRLFLADAIKRRWVHFPLVIFKWNKNDGGARTLSAFFCCLATY